MATLPESLDYSSKDFDALRARLMSLVKSVFPDWTDFDVASFGNLLLELYAFVGDVLTFYQDNLARESRLVTASQRKVMALPGRRSRASPPGRRRWSPSLPRGARPGSFRPRPGEGRAPHGWAP